LGGRRDASGVVGSINWLRKQMEVRGANPNVVRNIIYRDKGKLADKRVLFAILGELWESTGRAPLRAPELEVLLSSPPEGEHEVVQLLGREKRRAYGGFVGAVRGGAHPKLLITGRQGSGKTLLTDYIQQALEAPPKLAGAVIRQEFTAADLAASLQQLALALGVSAAAFEAKLSRIGVAGAYSVQADAQADVARLILERLKVAGEPLVLLLHVSQSQSGAQDLLGTAPLRLSTPDVPRVNLTEWLWYTLLEPISRLGHVSLLVSMANLPVSLLGRTGAFEGPIKLSPPTANEARRFVRARAQHLPAEQQEALVGRAKRSFEDLRTLTLLAEAREPLETSRHTEQLSQLVVSSGDARLKAFLEALAVLALPEYPVVSQEALSQLHGAEPAALSSLESAFLDAVPGEPGSWRPFSRQFARALRRKLKAAAPARFRALSLEASRFYAEAAHAAPRGDAAGRFVHHLFAARDWPALIRWAETAPIPQSLLQRLWRAAQLELRAQPGAESGGSSTAQAGAAQEEAGQGDAAGALFERVALQVASYYVRLGSTDHPDAEAALGVLAASSDPLLRAWTLLKRAESAVLQGRFEHAETLLQGWREVDDPVLGIEAALIRANLARWHSRLDEAAALTRQSTRALAESGVRASMLAVRVALWDGLIAKDQGLLEEALARFQGTATDDELLRARLHFQTGDVLLRLGRFGEAHTALSSAVGSAYQSEAPAFERARYLSRRGTLLRRQGAFGAARADFSAARTVLQSAELGAQSSRLAFERAKIHDEEALNLLAEGRTGSAIVSLQRNLEAFAGYGERYGVDPSFRILRSTLRLALAYGCRTFDHPYRLPLGCYPETAAEHPDLKQARRLVRRTLATLQGAPERYQGLKMQAHLAASLLLPPDEAVTEAGRALSAARYPYQQGQAQAYLCAALLRGGEHRRAREHLAAARAALASAGTDDYALHAYLAGLEASSLLYLDAPQEAHERTHAALARPQLRPYHDLLLYRLGEVAERLGRPLDSASLGLGDAPLPATLRPADALVMRWSARTQPADAQDPVPDAPWNTPREAGESAEPSAKPSADHDLVEGIADRPQKTPR
jgi:predicted negative regulator of RcsB-dependent stress response